MSTAEILAELPRLSREDRRRILDRILEMEVQAMAAWRMAFRAGTNGPEMWPHCHRLGVAAIQYGPVDGIDFSRYATEEQLPGEVKAAWSKLESTPRASLRRFLWEMKEEDVIYVKQGPMIVAKGVVIGPYQFDKKGRIRDPIDGACWQHQRSVDWAAEFPEVRIQLGAQQIATVKALTDEDIQSIEQAVGRRVPLLSLPAEEADQADANDGAAYVPEDIDRRRLVERQIKERRGQQDFRNALRKKYGDRCLVTECTVLDVLEAAHIKPYQGEGDNHPENGLLLRADIHTLFDLDLLGIKPDGLRVELHPSIAGEYGQFAGKRLGCAREHRPSHEALSLRYERFEQRVHRST